MQKSKDKTLLKKVFSLKNVIVSGMLIMVLAVFIVSKNGNISIINEKVSNKEIQQLSSDPSDSNYLTYGGESIFDDQGNQGTCYAYAITMAMSMNLYKNNKNNGYIVNLNESDIYNNFGTDGCALEVVWRDYLRYGNGVRDANGKQWYANECVAIDNATTSQIKNAIYTYGGVTSVVAWAGNIAKPDGKILMGNKTKIQDNPHAVCLIGWNDDFSAANFPANWNITQNGAFLAYNSNYGGKDWNRGILYISYQDVLVGEFIRAFVSDDSTYHSYSNPANPIYEEQGGGQQSLDLDVSRVTLSYNDTTRDPQQWGGGAVGWQYSGEKIRPTISDDVYDTEGRKLTKDVDYEIYNHHDALYPDVDNTNVPCGGVVHIYGIGNYQGCSKIQRFAIWPRELTEANLTVNASFRNSQGDEPEILSVTCSKTPKHTMVENVDYKIIEFKKDTQGVGLVKVEGIGNYTGTVEVSYKLPPTQWKEIDVTLEPTEFEYNGEQQIPKLILKYEDRELVLDRDYTVVQISTDCVIPSEQSPKSFTVIGKGNYSKLNTR